MVKCLRVCAAFWAALSGVDARSAETDSPPPRPPISVADVIGQAVIGDPMSPQYNDVLTQVSALSPNGEQVAVVLRRGNPARGTNDAQLLIYRTARLLDRPQPRIVASFASATNYQPIALVRWLADSQTLLFAGTQGSGLTQVYRVTLRTGEIRQLTDLRSALQWYDVTASGEEIVTMTEPVAAPANRDPECLQKGCRVTAETLYAAQYGVSRTSAPVTLHDLRAGTRKTLAPPEAEDENLIDCYDEFKGGLSPNGRFGVRLCRVRRYQWPGWWSDYTTNPELKTVLASGHNGYLRQWVLYDFERGLVSRLSPAPYYARHNYTSGPVWIDDGSRLLLAGALEPLNDVDARERGRRAAHYAILLIDADTRQAKRVAELDPRVQRVTATLWNQRTGMLAVESVDAADKPLPPALYRRAGAKWVTLPRRPSAAGSATARVPELFIKQALNEPPVLAARDPGTGRIHVVLDPDPWLSDRARGRVEEIYWESKDGRQWRGGLYYPASYVPGRRYPVVLQTHGFRKDTFALAGISRNFAAQPLAGLGIAVLQVAENTRGMHGAAEWPAVRAGYESAIDHLDALGLIDRAKVGIQGWSRTGPHTGYTLTQSSYRFAAGAFTMTADFGWWWYMSQGALHGETEYGVPPFGEGLDVWQRMSPSFNLTNVRTPMLLCGSEVTALWDWYAGLRRLGKPVEYWSLPDTTHEVFKVGERMRVNQLLVDWFRFWLEGEEDVDPDKAAQYLRWRALRQQQEQALAGQDRVFPQPLAAP